jgi:archaellin
MGLKQANALRLTDEHGQHVNADGDSIRSIQFMALQSGENGIELSVNQVEVQNMDSSAQVKANINAITMNQLLLRSNALSMLISSGEINDLVFNSGYLKEPFEILQDNYSTAAIYNMKAKIETEGSLIRFDRLDYDPTRLQGKVKDFELRPVKDIQQFLDDSFYQTNFMHTRIDSVSFHGFDARRLAEDSIIHLSHINVMSPTLEIDRDKTRPFYVGKTSYLPTNALQKLKVKLQIDTLQFGGGDIRYREKSKITGNEGLIYFTNLQGMVRNIKNIEFKNNDTLYIRASSRFMDSANVVLRVRESYNDTHGGFLMTTQVSPFHTSILNPVLVPLAAVEFESGYVDTLIMRAIGREHLSLGTMKFLYHDLRVTFLDKVDTSRRSLKNAILKFFANEFVIRTNNTSRIGTVFYERERHRSVIHYWVKMILSGATTSTGVKSSKRELRKYYKELNLKKLPPIDEKDIDF